MCLTKMNNFYNSWLTATLSSVSLIFVIVGLSFPLENFLFSQWGEKHAVSYTKINLPSSLDLCTTALLNGPVPLTVLAATVTE